MPLRILPNKQPDFQTADICCTGKAFPHERILVRGNNPLMGAAKAIGQRKGARRNRDSRRPHHVEERSGSAPSHRLKDFLNGQPGNWSRNAFKHGAPSAAMPGALVFCLMCLDLLKHLPGIGLRVVLVDFEIDERHDIRVQQLA